MLPAVSSSQHPSGTCCAQTPLKRTPCRGMAAVNDLDDFLAQLRTATSSALAIVPSPPRAQPSARNVNQSIPPTASTAQTSLGADDVVPLVAHDGAVLTAAQPAIPKAQRTAPEENIHSKIAETQAALQQSREMRAALVGPTSTARSINGRSNDINGGALNKSDRLMLQSAPDSSPMQAPRLLQRDSRTEPLAASKEKMDNAIDFDVSEQELLSLVSHHYHGHPSLQHLLWDMVSSGTIRSQRDLQDHANKIRLGLGRNPLNSHLQSYPGPPAPKLPMPQPAAGRTHLQQRPAVPDSSETMTPRNVGQWIAQQDVSSNFRRPATQQQMQYDPRGQRQDGDVPLRFFGSTDRLETSLHQQHTFAVAPQHPVQQQQNTHWHQPLSSFTPTQTTLFAVPQAHAQAVTPAASTLDTPIISASGLSSEEKGLLISAAGYGQGEML